MVPAPSTTGSLQCLGTEGNQLWLADRPCGASLAPALLLPGAEEGLRLFPVHPHEWKKYCLSTPPVSKREPKEEEEEMSGKLTGTKFAVPEVSLARGQHEQGGGKAMVTTQGLTTYPGTPGPSVTQ